MGTRNGSDASELPAVQVAVAADDFFAMPMAATLASIMINLDTEYRLEVTVLDGGIKPANVEKVERLTSPRCTLHWVRPDSPRFDQLVRRSASNYPAASWFRLLLPVVMPESVNRVIYIDTDVVVEDDLAKLWRTDLGDAWLAGAGCGFSMADAGHLSQLDLDVDLSGHYYNTGVLVIDLAAWRANDVVDLAFDYISSHSDVLPFADQDTLNIALSERWHTLPPRWNQTMAIRNHADGRPGLYDLAEIEEAVENPAIIHFTEVKKPWFLGCTHPEVDRFFHYLDHTAWSGWRPTRIEETRRLARRAIRRGRKVADRYLAKAGVGG